MPYDYVRRMYRVEPVVGARVRHTVTRQYGRIAPEKASQQHYVHVTFDGRNWSAPCHPDELDYNPAEAKG